MSCFHCDPFSDYTDSDNVVDNKLPGKQLPKTMAGPSNAGIHIYIHMCLCTLDFNCGWMHVITYTGSSDQRSKIPPLQLGKRKDCMSTFFALMGG